MHLSLKMYFLTNPHRSRTQVKELMILQQVVAKANEMMMNLDATKELERQNLLVQIF